MFLQLLINAVSAASVYMLVAFGFSLIYSTARFFHFAHAAMFVAGAYFAYALNAGAGCPLFISILIAVPLTALLGCLVDMYIYRPLRHKGSSSLIMLLASFGIYIVLQNAVSMLFSDDTKSLGAGNIETGFPVLGARITFIQLMTLLASITLLIILWGFMRRTKTGLALRAVANDPELANAVGLNSDRVILRAFAIGSILAGVAGILFALDVNMSPTMGMSALMMGIVAVIIGGVGSTPGVALGALLLGMAQHLGVWKISSQWQDAIAFVILLAFLLIKPEGLLGKKIRKAMV